MRGRRRHRRGLKFVSGWSKPVQLRAFSNRQSVASSTFGHQEWVGNEKRVRPGIHLTLVPMEALCAKPLRITQASSLPGIEVCFRLVKTCPAVCVFQPTFGRFFIVRPSRMVLPSGK